MACIQSQFSFRRPLPNLVKFELDVVCKVVLIFKCILRLTKTSRHRKIITMGMQVENIASHQECNMAWIQSQFSFRRPVPNLFKFELNVVCKFILIYKCVLRLRNKSKHRKKGIIRAYLNLYVASYSRGNWASYCFILTLLH